jgi:hypothetical protein
LNTNLPIWFINRHKPFAIRQSPNWQMAAKNIYLKEKLVNLVNGA